MRKQIVAKALAALDKPKLSELNRLMGAADVFYHGVGYSIMRFAESEGLEITENEAHELAASIIKQELADHNDIEIPNFYIFLQGLQL